MHFATLASGSSGNSILVGEGNRQFLVDSGITGKRLLHNLSLLGIQVTQVEGIVVTHEHADHIKGVGVLARKLKVPVYASAAIWDAMSPVLGKLDPAQKVVVDREFRCAGLDVLLFPTSHDSRESYGLRVEKQNGSGRKLALGIATDTGIITEAMHHYLAGCDGLVVEANHDEDRLWQGNYPWYLKQRISSIYGHLANKQLAEGLIEWLDGNTQQVVLAHLSEENNTPEIALGTVLQILRRANMSKKCPQVRFRVAPRHSPHELIVLREE